MALGRCSTSLHDAGDFDAITNLWVHVVLAVSADRLTTFDDGLPVSDAVYGFYTGGGVTVASTWRIQAR